MSILAADLVHHLIFRHRQVLERLRIELFAECARLELGIVIRKSCDGDMGTRAVRVGGQGAIEGAIETTDGARCSPGFGYESDGYDPFLTLSLSIHFRAASLSSSDAANRAPRKRSP